MVAVSLKKYRWEQCNFAERFYSLFPELSPEEQLIVDVLSKTNDLQVNLISVKTNIDISRLTSLLFTLEMKGVIKTFAGGMYHLLK